MTTTLIIILTLILVASLASTIANRSDMDEVHEDLRDIKDRIAALSLKINSKPLRNTNAVHSIEVGIELNEKKKEEFHRELDAISERLGEICERWNALSSAVEKCSGGEDHE